MKYRLTMLGLTLALGCATGARAEEFAAMVGPERFSVSCDAPGMLETPCKLGLGAAVVPVRFANQPTRYAHLLKEGVEKALKNREPSVPLDASDVAVLRELALEKCYPAAESDKLSGDTLQLCIPAGSTSRVVLFMRGVCDRCGFEPVVLKKP